MKKGNPAMKAASQSTTKAPVSKGNKSRGGKKRLKTRNLLKDIPGFRWFKKAMVGKTQEESLDLLDQWILKKKALGLFF